MVNGRKIREMREAEGLPISELASKVGVSQPAMTHFETGIKQPSVATLKRIADHFGVPMDELVIKETA